MNGYFELTVSYYLCLNSSIIEFFCSFLVKEVRHCCGFFFFFVLLLASKLTIQQMLLWLHNRNVRCVLVKRDRLDLQSSGCGSMGTVDMCVFKLELLN